ncbi:fasciclin domain-containing protein [Streptomyces sp. TRM 70351]|uniref:fasciclin domain-containing protein n=1 Tax=Streptomyces sp. TRM 70351 TaxID=3116552 RepID=UPI002E7BEA89|nr:fasciclin domain-containing protein [Streptomyces sp. TRM 70351]MEE1926946.1 fasciclin domain-containing protein [Streptomyces sp. TRM 70351]
MSTFRRIRRTAVAVTAAAVLPLAVTACGSQDDSASGPATPAAEERETGTPSEEATGSPTGGPGTEPFGPSCPAVPSEGDGSFAGMAQDPVATAASHNPELSTLAQAVQAADLTDTLNNAEDVTVFAPTNDAFAKIPQEDLDALLNDKEQLTEVLTYHVVDERLAPSDLEDGTFQTLAEQELTTSGSGEEYQVGDGAEVVCGNVQTANATVYMIDSVLMPQS